MFKVKAFLPAKSALTERLALGGNLREKIHLNGLRNVRPLKHGAGNSQVGSAFGGTDQVV